MNFEETARQYHRNGTSCANAVYQVFTQVNPKRTAAPAPRSEGGKCGAVLSAEKVLRETGIGSIEEFDNRFKARYGSLKCSELLGGRRGACNDYVGIAASIVGEMMDTEKQ